MNNSTPPPLVSTLTVRDVEARAKLEEEWRWQTFGEDVNELRSHQGMQYTNFPNNELVTDELEINLNMLRALMLNEVRC
jgi:hypothetical protein